MLRWPKHSAPKHIQKKHRNRSLHEKITPKKKNPWPNKLYFTLQRLGLKAKIDKNTKKASIMVMIICFYS